MIARRWSPLRRMMSRASRVLGIVELSGEDVGVAEDGRHGRADLVAHVGQEFALGAVGRVGGL